MSTLIEWFIRWRMDMKFIARDWRRSHWCEHDWQDEDGSPYKRVCSKCGRREWLMSHTYPAVGQPAIEWVEMHDPKWL